LAGRVVHAFAPGGVGNLGPGLDILGCAVTGPGDGVRARRIDQPGVRIDAPGHPELTRDPTKHAAGIAALAVLRRAGASDVGFAFEIEKGLPLAGGQGGSAASAVAGAMAANALLDEPFDRAELLVAALEAEEQLAGRHIDNVAPALFGGILLIRSIDPLDVIQLPVPSALRFAIVHPRMQLRTADARAVLPDVVDRATALAQAAAVAALVAALYTRDLSRLRGAIDDRIAEPVRAPMLTGFVKAKQAALDAGALGCSISGAGPSSFAIAEGDGAAERVMHAMVRAYIEAGVPAAGRVARVDEQGARVDEIRP
jgi:homoserine kinase